MKTNLQIKLLFSFLILSILSNFAQCNTMFFDTGGINGNYPSNENSTTTICPDNTGEVAVVSFINFSTESGYDNLSIYQGNSTASTLIGIYDGFNSPGVVTGNIANGGCLTFVFYSDSSVTSTGWEASVACEVPPTCFQPTNLIIDGVTNVTATLFWADENTPSSPEYEIEYGMSGFTQGTGTVITTTSNLTTITGLLSNTTYDFYIRSVCDINDLSSWTSVQNFTTLVSCLEPTNITLDGVNSTEATLFWVDSNTPSSPEYEIEYGTSGFTQGTGTTITATSNFTTITGLLSNTTYDFYIRSVCDVNDLSSWTSVSNFTTLASCLEPTNLNLNGTTETTAIITWFDNNSPQATEWEIEYGLSGFALGNGTTVTATTNPYTITGLLEGTTYDAYVSAICAVDDSSSWSNSLSFNTNYAPPTCGGMFFDTGGIGGNYLDDENSTTTICPDNAGELVIVSFINFETESGYDNLSIYQGDSTASTLIGVYDGFNSPGVVTGDVANGGCLTFVFHSDFIVTRSGWEASVTCEVPLACLRPTNIILDGVTSTEATLFWSDGNTPSSSEYEIEYGVSGFTQGTGTIITATSNLTTITGLLSNTTYDFYIRSVCDVNDSSYWTSVQNFTTLASCLEPTNLNLNGTTETTAIITWFDNNSPQATEWEIEYGLLGFTLGNGTIITATTNPYTITGLLEGTAYDIYVRAVCAIDDSSSWSNSLNFNTDYAPPACGGMFFDTGGIGGNYPNNENSTTTICPDNAGEVVVVSFINFETESGYDFLSIYQGDSTASTLISVYDGANSPGVVTGDIANGGCLTFVFNSDTIITGSGWEASITCETPPTCLKPIDVILDNITATTATLFWSDTNTPLATAWELEYGVSGFTQGTGTITMVASNFTEIVGLLSTTAYDFYVRSICDVDDFSSWSNVFTFNTDIALPTCGGVFVDTGNTSGGYQSNENYTITILPDNVGEYVTVAFTEFNVEQGWDGLMVYNGLDSNASLIDSGSTYNKTTCPNGAWTGILDGLYVPTSFTSTDSSGALTFVFSSDNSANGTGWLANVSCSTLDVFDTELGAISIYPNPANDFIMLGLHDLQSDVDVKIYSVHGQQVYKDNHTNETTQIDISNLSSGVYFIHVNINNKGFLKKFIKK